MKILISSLFSFITIVFHAQEVYVPIKSNDPLPQSIQARLSDQLNSSMEDFDEESISNRSDRKDFVLKSNYSINEILRGGQVIFNDEITNYLESVRQIIYEYNPNLPEEIQVYTLRSTMANAFSTSEGVVVVTTGLLAQLETEAQLAFILCHEISHYVKQHVVENYVESKENLKSKIRTKNDYESYVAVMSKFSKNHEFEADSEGADYFLNTPYVSAECYTAFDVLHYSYLPFDELAFDYSILENDYFTLEDNMKLKETTPIDVFNEDYDDSESDHPNIWKRKKKIKDILESQSDAGEELFIFGEENFFHVQDLSRRENIRINLMQSEYVSAIYSSFLLLKDDSTDVFAQKSIAKAFYGIHQYSVYGELNEVIESYDDVEGESSAIHYLIKQLNSEELNVLCFQQVHKAYMLDPDNDYFKDLMKDLIFDMVWEEELNASDFDLNLPKLTRTASVLNDSIPVDSVKTETLLVIEDSGRASKYDKIDQLKETGNDAEKESEVNVQPRMNYHIGLIGVFNDSPELLAYFEEISEDFESDSKSRVTGRDRYLDPYKDKKKLKELNKNGASLGLDNFIVYDPNCLNFSTKGDVQYLNSEEVQVNYADYIQDFALQSGADTEVLRYLSSEEVLAEDYNKMSFLSAWTFEVDLHHANDVDMIPSESEYVYSNVINCDQNYLVYSNIYYYPEKRQIEPNTWLYSALLYPTLPFTIIAACTRIKHNFHFIAVYDLRTGSLVHSNVRDLKIKQPNQVVKGIAYDTVQQLTRKKR